MRDRFPEFYTPRAEEFKRLWQEAIFVLDANVLLDIFRYSPETCAQLLKVLERLGDRIWEPYQAALEYHCLRHGVVSDLLAIYDKAAKKFADSLKEIENSLNKYSQSDALLSPLSASIAQVQSKLEETKATHSKRVPDERLHEQLSSLLEGRVGAPYDPATLAVKHKEADDRFKEKVPPGYKDTDKPKPDRYGDYIMWSQITDYAKNTGKAIVFVTGDAKDDWWWEERGKTLGPRPELRREMRDVAGVEFYMYSPVRFLEHARTYFDLGVTDEAIAEARDVQAQAAKDTRGELLNPWMQAIYRDFDSAADIARKSYESSIMRALGYEGGKSLADHLIRSPREMFDGNGVPVRVTERLARGPSGAFRFVLVFEGADGTNELVLYPADWYMLPESALQELYSRALAHQTGG